MEELLDLFTAHGEPTGVTIRRGEEAPAGMYWAVCDVWLTTPEGRVLIQRRADSKPNHPGQWCESAGGAVQSGESPEAAALRETREEIGFTPDFRRGGKVFEFVGHKALHHVFVFCQPVCLEQLTLQVEEVSDARLATPEEILRMAREGSFVPMGYLHQLMGMLPVLIHAYGKEE